MSLLENGAIQCDGCGRFIPIADLASNAASHVYALPDSEFSKEAFESLCKNCRKKIGASI